ncbi:unnamed protein product [Paramecium octaurelia]|uniref:Uncharacterized protein n=1 Tax=Paramecium octaurelia TaxID=43137 RepID=A0A8S1S9T5_PAROT|nr:unnamed protein product [Paramecium octaurelia]
MEKNKKLKKTKDSILIRKNGKYSENAGEVARQRSIYMLLLECGILIAYLIFLILYAVQGKFKMLYLSLQIVIVSLQILCNFFSIHSMIFFKEYIITKSSNLYLILVNLVEASQFTA